MYQSLADGIGTLTGTDFDALRSADNRFDVDYLDSVFPKFGISDYIFRQFQSEGCSADDVKRYACILSLIATESGDKISRIGGVEIRIRSSDTLRTNLYIDIAGFNMIQLCEDWGEHGFTWNVISMNPLIYDPTGEDIALLAIIKAYK